MRAYFACVVPVALGFCCTSTLAQTATLPAVVRIAHVGDESVPLRITKAPPPDFPASVRNDKGMPGGFFAPLAADARAGDDLAAQYLWQSLMLCRNVPSTPAEQLEKLDAVKSDYALTGGHGNTLQ
jgi:hypothetical protein